jgi:hypothetical protein
MTAAGGGRGWFGCQLARRSAVWSANRQRSVGRYLGTRLQRRLAAAVKQLLG